MPRFVILEHDYPLRHWDLMLEFGPVLRTWRLAEPPLPGKVVAAEPTFDHRLMYLDYEGPVSGDRGNVKRWQSGTFDLKHELPDLIEIAYQYSDVKGILSINRLNNCWFVQVFSSSSFREKMDSS